MSTIKTRQIGSFFTFFILSFFVVALGQPAWFGALGFFAAFIGYALFWRAMLFLEKKSSQFFLATFWFTAVQALQLSWMTSMKYQGPYILIVYGFLCLAIGIQFGLLSLLVSKLRPLSGLKILAIASVWVIFEWLRLFFISGFGWNPVGMALSTHHYSTQMAVLWGVYGLSFWVIAVNLVGLRALFFRRTAFSIGTWIVLAVFPYLFGSIHQQFQIHRFAEKQPLSVLLVQTALMPEEREPFPPFSKSAISPLSQWFRILNFIKHENRKQVDLIVLPEGALPYGAFRGIYALEDMKFVWEKVFGSESLKNLPDLKEPLAYQRKTQYESGFVVTNVFWAQALSNQLHSEVVLGLDTRDPQTKQLFNSAFFFKPNNSLFSSYQKRVLVPLGEYIPYKWAEDLAKKFGIVESFSPGKAAKLFIGKLPIGISICNEETYPYLLRKMRNLGADVFVNITNDVWFPNSKLPYQHFEHGRIRAVENGVAVVRSCNTGITGAVDCFGRVIKKFESDLIPSEKLSGVLYLDLPTQNYATLYTFWGDNFVLSASLVFILWAFIRRKKRL